MPGGRGASHNLFSHLSSARSATENRAYTHAFFLPKKRTRDDRPIRHALSPEWRKKEAQVLSAKNKVHLYFGCAKKAARYPCVCARGQFFLLFKLFCWPQKSEKRLPPPRGCAARNSRLLPRRPFCCFVVFPFCLSPTKKRIGNV